MEIQEPGREAPIGQEGVRADTHMDAAFSLRITEAQSGAISVSRGRLLAATTTVVAELQTSRNYAQMRLEAYLSGRVTGKIPKEVEDSTEPRSD